MALAHNLGCAHIGRDRELKKAREAFLNGELDEASLRAQGRKLRAAHWQAQKDAGVELLPVGDFAWYDPVLNHSLMFGVVPARLSGHDVAEAMTPWFDTNDHYLAPTFTAEQAFALSWEQLFEEVDEAKALGHAVKPVVIGPLTYLWLGKSQGGFDKLELVDSLLPVYDQIFNRLAAQGVEWVQIDEPILALELPQDWKNAYERVYNILQRAPLKKLVATYFGGLKDNLGLAANLPVDGLHIDLVQAPEQFPTILDRLPTYKILSLGVVNGRNARRCDQGKALEVLRHAAERLGDRLWVAPSCPLLHSPVVPAGEDPLDAQAKGRLALVVQKCQDVVLLTETINAPEAKKLRRSALA